MSELMPSKWSENICWNLLYTFMKCHLKRKEHSYEYVAAESKDTGKCIPVPAELLQVH
jgi:hypothetical protein